MREQTSNDSEIKFSIVKVIDSLNKTNVIYSEITNELNNLKNDNNRRTIQSVSTSTFNSRAISTKSRREFDGSRSSAKSQDFFQEHSKMIRKKYTTTRIKSRNFLSNIAYVGISKEDYYNENFVFDIYLLLTKNLNTFSLDRKLSDKTKHEMVYMLWKELCQLVFINLSAKNKTFSI